MHRNISIECKFIWGYESAARLHHAYANHISTYSQSLTPANHYAVPVLCAKRIITTKQCLYGYEFW